MSYKEDIIIGHYHTFKKVYANCRAVFEKKIKDYRKWSAIIAVMKEMQVIQTNLSQAYLD